MMTDGQQALLTVLTDFIAQRPSVLPDGINRTALIALARQQQVDAIAAFQTRWPELASARSLATYCAAQHLSLRQKLHGAFREAGVRFLVLKGNEIAAYYPQPALRQMGDTDILIDPEHADKAEKALNGLGFCGDGAPITEREVLFSRGDMMVEMHGRLLYPAVNTEERHLAFAARAWEEAVTEDGVAYRLDSTFHAVYLLLHLRRHFLWAGIPLRQLLDLACMAKNARDIAWDRVEQSCRELGIFPFVQNCFALVERWLGVASPMTPVSREEAFYSSAVETVFAFDACRFRWFTGEQMVDNEITDEFRGKQGGIWRRIGAVLRVCFPPYAAMKQKYPRMGRCAALLPLMWIRRLLEAAVRRDTASAAYALKPVSLAKKAGEREAFLNTWGLL